MLTISTHVARFETYAALAEANRDVFCTVGTHPHNAGEEPGHASRHTGRAVAASALRGNR